MGNCKGFRSKGGVEIFLLVIIPSVMDSWVFIVICGHGQGVICVRVTYCKAFSVKVNAFMNCYAVYRRIKNTLFHPIVLF